MLPSKNHIRICFAHPAYQMAEQFAARNSGIAHIQVRTDQDLVAEIPGIDVLVISQMWKNELIGSAKRLRFIQSISAGGDQFDEQQLRTHGIRLASAAGITAQAVAEHAMALMLALRRHLHTARDNQLRKHWCGMISHIPSREDQLGGKTLLIIGLGRIGTRLARLAKAFDMRVIGTKRDPSRGVDNVDTVVGNDRLINAAAIAAMKPSVHLVNVARGAIVNEAALIQALQEERVGAAGLDVMREEPLPVSSPLWTMPNVLITPHKAGETQRLEDGVIDVLMENLARQWRGEIVLENQLV